LPERSTRNVKRDVSSREPLEAALERVPTRVTVDVAAGVNRHPDVRAREVVVARVVADGPRWHVLRLLRVVVGRERCDHRDARDRGADRGLVIAAASDAKLGSAAAIDPYAAPVIAPRFALVAARARKSPLEPHLVVGVDPAIAVTAAFARALDRLRREAG
jgi:hypothetical protein